jgi:predicted PhzF superfamily epimerase YddE/YHI9
VVTDILGLNDEKMQRLTTDLGFSETIFLNWSDGPRPKARIFTPAREIPFAGHPLVGAAWVLINLGPLDPGGIDCAVGKITIRQEDGVTWIGAPADQPVSRLDARDAEGFGTIEIVEVKVPSPYTLIQVRSPSEVSTIKPAQVRDWGDVYVWAWESEGVEVKARFFAPQYGIEEDPATGSAAVALAARMRWSGTDHRSLRILQGEEIGHPSELRLEWDPDRTSVGGTVIKDEVRFLNI